MTPTVPPLNLSEPLRQMEKVIEPVAAAAADASVLGVEDTVETVAKAIDYASTAQAETLEAAVSASDLLTTAAGKFAEEMLAFNDEAVDQSLTAAREILECKDLVELINWQSKFAQGYFNALVDRSTKMTDMALDTVRHVAGPLQEQAKTFYSKLNIPTA